MTSKLHPSFAIHPGVWLRTEIIEPSGMNVTKAAERLHVTSHAMNNLINGNEDLSAEMAIRFEKVFGIKADSLMRMRAAHELAQARLHEDQIEVDLPAA